MTAAEVESLPRVALPRVITAAEATALVGTRPGHLEPNLRDPVLITDADTGEPVLGHLPMPNVGAFRAFILGIEWGGSTDVYRANSGSRNKSWTFGYRPRKPMMRNEGCVLSMFGRDNPRTQAFLSEYAGVLARQLGEAFPEIEVMGREAVSAVLPDWRLSEESLWTSGVINKESCLPYHRDGNNFDAWSAMPVVRRGVRGGHLHIPEYDLVVPCRDGFTVMFYGKGLVHGVTPMTRITPDAYRVSVVYYALRGLKDCHTYAEETAYAARRRTERETELGRRALDPNDPGPERILTKATRPSTGNADRRGSWANPTPLPADARPAGARDDTTCNPDWPVLEDLAAFARLELSTRDVEPWADLIAALHTSGTLDLEQTLWVATLYNTYDDLGSAWSVFRRWPSLGAWAEAPDRTDVTAYPCTQERRNLRGGKVARRFESFAAEVAGADLLSWMSRPLTGDDPAGDFVRLTNHMRAVWGVGRQSAFEWAEFAAKCAGVPVDCGDAQLWESEGPRRSLQRLYGNPRPTRRWLDARLEDTMTMLSDRGVTLAVVDFETIICDFNVMRDGRYYVGRHLAALREEIDGMPPADRADLDAQWNAFVPEPWRGITPGINKALLGVYRDTGRIIDTP